MIAIKPSPLSPPFSVITYAKSKQQRNKRDTPTHREMQSGREKMMMMKREGN
jgi:hypothetical protein